MSISIKMFQTRLVPYHNHNHNHNHNHTHKSNKDFHIHFVKSNQFKNYIVRVNFKQPYLPLCLYSPSRLIFMYT